MSLRVLRIFGIVTIAALAAAAVAHSDSNPGRFDPLLKTNWYGLYMQGAKVGHVKISLEEVQDPVSGWKYQSQMNIVMRMGDQKVTIGTDDAKFFEGPGGELHSSSFNLTGPTGDMKVVGRTENDSFVVESNIGGQVTAKSFPHPFDYLDSALAVELSILSGSLAIGDTLSFSAFEASPPLTGLISQRARVDSQETFIINGVPTEAYAVSIFMPALNITTQSIIDLHGNTLEASPGGQMTIKLEGEEQAKLLDDTYDVITNNLIIPDRQISDPGAVQTLSLRITGIDSSDALLTGMQKVTADSGGLRFDISRQSAPGKPVPLGKVPDEAKAYLASDPFEQSDDPQIIKLAREIVGDENDSWRAARKINTWVYENIEKRFTPDFSNALQTLNSGRGDCGEHTALAVALMRAAGIPARPVVGLVYWPPGGGFGYHAWTEVFAGGWLQMDPSWGEDLANPTHIALARGDIISQVSIMHRVMGRMEIEILDMRLK